MASDFKLDNGRFVSEFGNYQLAFEPMIMGGWMLALYERSGDSYNLMWQNKMELPEQPQPESPEAQSAMTEFTLYWLLRNLNGDDGE